MKKLSIPKVIRSSEEKKDFDKFPVDHYSYSAWTKFSSNPFMFKVNNINGDYLDTTATPSNVLGRAIHKGLEVYYQSKEDDGEAIKKGYEVGFEYLKNVTDGFIEYNTVVQNRAKLEEKFSQCYFGYIQEVNIRKEAKEILLVEKMLKYKVEVDGKMLPIPLKGSADLVYLDQKDRIIIRDHKFTGRYSGTDEIDGAKLIQAAFNFFLVYAELGKAPYSMIYEEHKISKNADGSRQTKEYEIVFSDHPLIFELFYRLYEDITNALLGKQVFIPNIYATFDKEVSILAYIHRLDVDEYREKAFKAMDVTNITDFLKKKIEKDGAMKKYLDVVSKNFVSATTLNYKDMEIHERIKMKLAEHGIAVEYHDHVIGSSVALYRYEPSIGIKMSRIEAYAKDIEQVVEATGVRILAPIPNTGFIGFEIPLKERKFPEGIPGSKGFDIAIGLDVMGEVSRFDIREAPHLLVAGSTGSGKSVFLNTLIHQLMETGPTSELYLYDPKMVELGIYEGKGNVKEYSSDIEQIHQGLTELRALMDYRYSELKKNKVRNIKEYREKVGDDMKYIFVVIDEYGDLIAQKHVLEREVTKGYYKDETPIIKIEKQDVSGEIKDNILILSQKARAAGIHIILTTQRPSVNIVDGSIKANFPTRIAFKTSSQVDSVVILDQGGAEKLLGKGDMLFLNPQKGLERLQGFYV